MFVFEDTLAQMDLFLWIIAFRLALQADPLNTSALSSITSQSRSQFIIPPFLIFPTPEGLISFRSSNGILTITQSAPYQQPPLCLTLHGFKVTVDYFLYSPPPLPAFYVCVRARREKCLSYEISFPPPSLRVSSPTGAAVLHKLSLGSIFFALQRIGHLEQIQLKLACELIIGVSYQDKWNASKLDFIHFTASHNSSARVYHPRSCLTLSSFYDD